MSKFAYDVVIVGGSFAGLAAAMQLRGHRVLLLDQYPIGSHLMSACGTPLTTARAVGAEDAVQEIHHSLVLHTGGAEISFALQDPFVTFDYGAFCRTMLAQTDADVWQIRATGIDRTEVVTKRGTVSARFVVNATGWRGWAALDTDGATRSKTSGYGLETELPVRLVDFEGLHFYAERKLVSNGYAWVFPCGDATRIGIGSFEPNAKLRPRLAEFLNRFDLPMGNTHGGVLAIERRDPVVDGVFLAGDAAGQCLPVTGEGIRTAIFHGTHCGQAIANSLNGTLSPLEARALYWNQVCSMDRFHADLLGMQTVVARTPEPALAWAARVCSWHALTRRIMAKYLNDSGWFVGQPDRSAVKSGGSSQRRHIVGGSLEKMIERPARHIQ